MDNDFSLESMPVPAKIDEQLNAINELSKEIINNSIPKLGSLDSSEISDINRKPIILSHSIHNSLPSSPPPIIDNDFSLSIPMPAPTQQTSLSNSNDIIKLTKEIDSNSIPNLGSPNPSKLFGRDTSPQPIIPVPVPALSISPLRRDSKAASSWGLLRRSSLAETPTNTRKPATKSGIDTATLEALQFGDIVYIRGRIKRLDGPDEHPISLKIQSNGNNNNRQTFIKFHGIQLNRLLETNCFSIYFKEYHTKSRMTK